MSHQFTAIEIALIVALGVVELGLLVAAWIVLFRTPTARLTLPKWAWAVICLVQFIGPIAFFAAGRKPKPVVETAPHPDAASTTARVVDDLYGDR
jgi:hypothetical protein